jgi:hypothetical protein
MPVSLSPSRLLRANLSALSLRPAERLDLSETLFLMALHTAGLTSLALFLHLPWVIVFMFLSGLVIPQFALRKCELLAPFFFAYAVLLMRFVFVRMIQGTVDAYFDYLLPEWGLALLHVQAATLAAAIYSMLISAVYFLRSRRPVAWMAALILVGGTLTWASLDYFGHRTRGTTGSDPYAYVQMGIDLATRGSVVHRFALFPEFAPLRIPWYPLVHVSYHLPMNEQGDAVTVFPAGVPWCSRLLTAFSGKKVSTGSIRSFHCSVPWRRACSHGN